MGSPTYYNLSVYHHRKRKGIRIMVVYAVWIEEKILGEPDYVRETQTYGQFWYGQFTSIKLFDRKSMQECILFLIWNTGEVVEYVRQQPTTESYIYQNVQNRNGIYRRESLTWCITNWTHRV